MVLVGDAARRRDPVSLDVSLISRTRPDLISSSDEDDDDELRVAIRN